MLSEQREGAIPHQEQREGGKEAIRYIQWERSYWENIYKEHTVLKDMEKMMDMKCSSSWYFAKRNLDVSADITGTHLFLNLVFVSTT